MEAIEIIWSLNLISILVLAWIILQELFSMTPEVNMAFLKLLIIISSQMTDFLILSSDVFQVFLRKTEILSQQICFNSFTYLATAFFNCYSLMTLEWVQKHENEPLPWAPSSRNHLIYWWKHWAVVNLSLFAVLSQMNSKSQW